MSKYDAAFRWQVVEQCLSPEASTVSIAQRYGLDYSMVRRWVERYRKHGIAGLEAKHRGCRSAAFKMSVLETMRREGLSYRQTAILFDIRSDGDVGRWDRLYQTEGLQALTPTHRRRPSMIRKPAAPSTATSDDKRTRDELLAELAYLRAENDYLKKLDALIQEKRTTRDTRRKSFKS
tara:strand:- start:859 stop:1392 length:534 start_codon:yes stop_codon:yes gene_type:complete